MRREKRGDYRDVWMVGSLTGLLDSNPNSKISLTYGLAALTENSFL
jgi:hypothetical protein